MRKSSKAVSLFLSGLMATSCFSMAAVTASAATGDSEATGAIMTLEERLAAGHEVVLFQFPENIWGPRSGIKWSTKKHTVNICCNFYAIYGNKKPVKSRAWEAPSTNMLADSKDSDVFYFDITDSKQIAEKDDTDDHKMEPGAAYGILFSTKANADNPNTLKPNTDGYQTCDLYFDTSCIGDTFVVDTPAVTRENTANSQKIDYYAHSLNGVGRPIRKITTLCEYLDGVGKELDGKTIVNGNTLNCVPDSLEAANRLKDYLPKDVNEPSFSKKKVAAILPKFETNAVDVYWMYEERFNEDYANAASYVHVDGVDDQKSDGTLKDCYRYKWLVKDAGTLDEETLKMPYKTLVAERLGLIEPGSQPGLEPADGVIPKQVKDVIMTLDTDGSINTPEDANYTVEITKAGKNCVATVSPKAGYAFTAKPGITLTAFPEGTTTAYSNGKTYIDTVDGKVVVTYPGPIETLIENVSIYPIDSAHLVGGQPAPQATPNDDSYTAETVFTPAAETFAYDTEYTMTVTFTAKDGYFFNEATTCGLADLNGATAQLIDRNHIKVQYTFTTPKKAISEVKLDFGNKVINTGKEVTAPTVADDADYTVETAWTPADTTFAGETDYTLTATFTAKDGCEFKSTGSFCRVENLGDESAACNIVSQKLVDGKFVVVLSFQTNAEPVVDKLVERVSIYPINSARLVGGQPAPQATPKAVGGDNYTAETVFAPAAETFAYDTEYTMTVNFTANDGYFFDDTTACDLADLDNATAQLIDNKNIKVQYTFKTEKKQFAEVKLDFDNKVINTDEAVVAPVVSADADYTVETAWAPADDKFAPNADYTLTATFTAKDGCEFRNTGVFCRTENLGEGSAECTIVSQNLVDGKLVVVLAFHTDPRSPIFGDVDGDGIVTINDATLIQRRGIELEKFTAQQDLLADVNRDGRVSILDVTCISRYLAEMTEGTGWTGLKLEDVVNAD